METVQAFDTAERIVALRSVGMFSELQLSDLENIAERMVEQRFDPGEPVYRRDEPGDEMMMVVQGAAIVQVDQSHEFMRGPGEHIGEMALLRHQPRSADVIAGEDGLHGLVMNSATFESVLEERPAIALAVLETLAQRLADSG